MKPLLTALFICISATVFAQPMNVKVPNFTSFTTEQIITSELQNKLSSAKAKEHPEYGVIPYNAPCNNCFELIDKRNQNTRLFIDVNNEGHIYSQQSQLPVSYQDSPNAP